MTTGTTGPEGRAEDLTEGLIDGQQITPELTALETDVQDAVGKLTTQDGAQTTEGMSLLYSPVWYTSAIQRYPLDTLKPNTIVIPKYLIQYNIVTFLEGLHLSLTRPFIITVDVVSIGEGDAQKVAFEIKLYRHPLPQPINGESINTVPFSTSVIPMEGISQSTVE